MEADELRRLLMTRLQDARASMVAAEATAKELHDTFGETNGAPRWLCDGLTAVGAEIDAAQRSVRRLGPRERLAAALTALRDQIGSDGRGAADERVRHAELRLAGREVVDAAEAVENASGPTGDGSIRN